MILYFANRKMEILGNATTSLPEGFVIIDDQKVEEIDTGTRTFSCRINFNKNTRLELEDMTEVGNYVLRYNADEKEFYTILDTEIDTKNQEIYIYAEDAGLDLLNEIAEKFEADDSYNIEWYINKYIADSGFEIGTNEVASSTVRKLAWTGESTVTERLASIATEFDGCEVSFSFEVTGMEITKKYVNIHKERGKSVEEELRLDRDIDRIVIKKSVVNLATAFKCKGGIPEGKEEAITLVGYVYDDGDFYVDDNGILCSREALSKWSRYVWNKEPNKITSKVGNIIRTYSYDTTDQKTLCSHAVTELKKICDKEVNYEVDISRLPDNISVGDRVNIVDDVGELYLSARILVLETSVTKKTHKATLGEYLIKDSGISQKVEELASQFSKLAKKTLYTWTAYADDENGTGISLSPSGKNYLGTATNQSTKDVDIIDPSVFTWVKIKGEDGTSGEDATVLRIESSRGVVFKNNDVSTVLSVVIYKGSKRITDIDTLHSEYGKSAYIQWLWQRIGEEMFGTILSTDKRISNDGFVFTLSPEDVNTKVVFMCQLITD